MTTKHILIDEPYGQADPLLPNRPYVFYAWDSGGGNTPYALRKQGKYSENAYTVAAEWRSSGQAKAFAFGAERWCNVTSFGATPVYDSVSPPLFGDVVNRLLEKWRASSFDAGVTIGEGRESVQMMVKRISSLTKAANALRRGDFGSVGRQLSGMSKGDMRSAASMLKAGANNLSNAWLELQFGWIPLARDIGDLAEFVKTQPRENRVRTSKKTTGGSHAACADMKAGVEYKHIRNIRSTHLVVVCSGLPSTVERLGLTNPHNIAWNLMGGSFLADWIFPISAHLNAIHATGVMPVVKVIRTDVSKKSGRTTISAGKVYCGRLCLMGGVADSTYLSMGRQVFPSLPTAWLATPQVPSEIGAKWDPDLRKLSLAAALAHQRLRF